MSIAENKVGAAGGYSYLIASMGSRLAAFCAVAKGVCLWPFIKLQRYLR